MGVLAGWIKPCSILITLILAWKSSRQCIMDHNKEKTTNQVGMTCLQTLYTWKSLKSLKPQKKGEKSFFFRVNRASYQFDSVDLGSEKCWAVFSGQKQSKWYQLGRWASPAETLFTWKSLKLATIWKTAKMVFCKNTLIQWLKNWILNWVL